MASPAPPPPPNGMVLAKARGWLGLAMPVLERATPVGLLLVLVLGGIMLHEQGRELARRAKVNEYLAEKILAYQEQQLQWLRERVHCTAPGRD